MLLQAAEAAEEMEQKKAEATIRTKEGELADGRANAASGTADKHNSMGAKSKKKGRKGFKNNTSDVGVCDPLNVAGIEISSTSAVPWYADEATSLARCQLQRCVCDIRDMHKSRNK